MIKYTYLSREVGCTLNLISIQQGRKETKASREKYFNAIINDTLKDLRKRKGCFLFNREQIKTIKKLANKEKIMCVVTPIEDGIWLVQSK